MLEKILKDHKVLIFSQFKGMLYLIEDLMQEKGVNCVHLTGDTPNSQRKKLIDKFNSEEQVRIFLLSTRAGGLGLNLVAADTVFIMDSDFNPHNDLQALSRAHRIGQKKNVLVYRFLAKDSVEEKILEAAKRKMMLDTVVQQTSKDMIMKVISFGTRKLFHNNVVASTNVKDEYKLDMEALTQILDRDAHFVQVQEEEAAPVNDGIEDYLSAFRVADFDNKGAEKPKVIDLDEVLAKERESDDG